MLARLVGPRSILGLMVALTSITLDQAHKLWMLFVFDIAERQPIGITSFFDVVLVWNRGISYGLLQQYSEIGRWGLIGFRFAAVILLLIWLARAPTRFSSVALGLIIGGAIGNGIDGVAYGAVADFFYFHIGSFDWYVFNIADIAIVAGVALLLYEAVLGTGQPGDAA
jgi:signal peptidase II